MNHFTEHLVKKRTFIFIATILIAIVSGILLPRIGITSDMTRYLPDRSQMKRGVDILADEFPNLMSMSGNSVLVMFKDVPENEKTSLKEELAGVDGVDSVVFVAGDISDDKDGYSLYTLNTSYAYSTDEMNQLTDTLKADFDRYEMQYIMGSSAANALPFWIVAAALLMILVILFIMCSSWLEPLLLIITIGLAVLINMGTNLIFGQVSNIVYMIGSLLQLVLSMDYSIILLNRYRQELHALRPAGGIPEIIESEEAMRHALRLSFASITGSALTTIVGLLALMFMQFKIGAELGIALAKGVLISCICVFTVMPTLIIAARGILIKTAKRKPILHLHKLAVVENRLRYVILGIFVLFVIATFAMKDSAKIVFTLEESSAITDQFPPNSQIVLVVDKADSDAMVDLSETLASNAHVRTTFSWAGTVERGYTAAELTTLIDKLPQLMPQFTIEEDAKALIAPALKLIYDGSGNTSMNVPELMDYVKHHLLEDSAFSFLVGDRAKDSIEMADTMLAEAEASLRSEAHELLIIMTDLPEESEETGRFLDEMDAYCKDHFEGEYSIVGNAPMAWDMKKTFRSELSRITWITALAILIVVLINFRTLMIPVLLVLMIQSAVYATMCIIHLQGISIYYLALLMVQSILMGALIDYAILFTNHYRENRAHHDRQTSIDLAYEHALPTIMTSGLIIVIITGILGYTFPNPTVGQICHTISMGALCSLLLILIILPGLLTAVDRKP